MNIEVPRDLWRKVKAQAALEERPVRYVVEDALRAYLEKKVSRASEDPNG